MNKKHKEKVEFTDNNEGQVNAEDRWVSDDVLKDNEFEKREKTWINECTND